ncbi:MAG: PUR family DNA/RNA-binding protein, partial [Bacteroidetes bacterium]|nr:PUR family DNA/RNA-binding protein [Bacteroidota bacterium]
GDYYLTITESKKFTNEDGSFHYKKHKIYLYKEDFADFKDNLNEMIQYIIDAKGEEVISDRHQSDYNKEEQNGEAVVAEESAETSSFTDIDFDDI